MAEETPQEKLARLQELHDKLKGIDADHDYKFSARELATALAKELDADDIKAALNPTYEEVPQLEAGVSRFAQSFIRQLRQVRTEAADDEAKASTNTKAAKQSSRERQAATKERASVIDESARAVPGAANQPGFQAFRDLIGTYNLPRDEAPDAGTLDQKKQIGELQKELAKYKPEDIAIPTLGDLQNALEGKTQSEQSKAGRPERR